MKKRAIALALSLLFFLGLGPLGARAAGQPYFIAVNDELLLLSIQTAPILVGGVTYIPCTIFDSGVTGVNIGVSYSLDSTAQFVYLKSGSKTLDFDIASGTAYSATEDKTYHYQAVSRGGMPYLPAANVCRYFGLTCSFLYTDSGQMLRIKNGSQGLDDEKYIRAARPILEEWAAAYGQPNPPPPAPPSPQKPEDAPLKPGQSARIYLGIRVESGANLPGILDALERGHAKAILFFPTNQVAAMDGLLRQAAVRGHKIGFIAPGGTLEEQLSAIRGANELLVHILKQKAVFILAAGQESAVLEGLGAQGYLNWRPGITMSSKNTGASTIPQALVDKVSQGAGVARVLLDDGLRGGTYTTILSKLREGEHSLRTPRETDF